jgi:hypothetical protein
MKLASRNIDESDSRMRLAYRMLFAHLKWADARLSFVNVV